MRVLVIEDDERLADVLARGLADAGHEPTVRHTGPDGLAAAARSDAYDAVVLDWMLPGFDGPSICRSLRAAGNDVPVLLLTARSGLPYRINGLDAGADDFLAKPFSLEELLARLRVFARRAGRVERLAVGDLVIDRERRTVTRADRPIELTAREFDLLVTLAERAGRVVTRTSILDAAWDDETDLRSNAIDVHIGRLRAKVDKPFARNSIQTVRGIGFRLADS